MTNPTSNFGWQMPTPTDLVTDLPADFEVFGQAVDTDFADLLGGTTGQILSKASGTDLDFTWITNDVGDITAVTAGTGITGGGTSGAVTITNSMATAIDAKGDLIAGTGADTFARLATGTAGQILAVNTGTATGLEWITPNPGDITAVNVTAPITGGGTSGDVTIGVSAASTSASGVVQLSDSTSTTSSVLASTPTATKAAYDLAASAYDSGFTNNFFAGKNKIINGKFDVWQRGTSFSTGGYTSDRWTVNFSGATGTVSQQTFTPGTAPVAGYEGTFFLRFATTVADDNSRIEQKIENVRTFAGETVTVSLWAKADSARTITINPYQSFGSGGSADVAIASQTISVTTAWTRFTKTFAIPSVAGKTIGTGSFLSLELLHAPNATFTLDIWGVQMEAGSVATPFQTASGSIGEELLLCQRYYFRNGGLASYMALGGGTAESTTKVDIQVAAPATMRALPTAVDFSTIAVQPYGTGTITAVTAAALGTIKGLNPLNVELTVASGLTQGVWYRGITNNSTSGYLGFSAEL
jgi:hypothetical protein